MLITTAQGQIESPSDKVGNEWWTVCDGMPTMMGCGAQIWTTVPYTRTGTKKSGWFITEALDNNNKPDPKYLLAFCPSCAVIVKEQMKK